MEKSKYYVFIKRFYIDENGKKREGTEDDIVVRVDCDSFQIKFIDGTVTGEYTALTEEE